MFLIDPRNMKSIFCTKKHITYKGIIVPIVFLLSFDRPVSGHERFSTKFVTKIFSSQNIYMNAFPGILVNTSKNAFNTHCCCIFVAGNYLFFNKITFSISFSSGMH